MSRIQKNGQDRSRDADEAIIYARKHNRQHLEELKTLLRMQSISTLTEKKTDIAEAADWLAGKLKAIGMETVEVIPTDGHPLVYADWIASGDESPTLLLYGHYDVQPVDPLDLWDRDPFEPVELDDYLYARGASDDKGQLFILLRSLESYLQGAGRLPLNVKVILEGEEETNGKSLADYVAKNKNYLGADAALISDSAMHAKGQPSIVCGLRGICYVLMDLVGPDHDLHSGSFGGAIDNPLNVLGHIIGKLKDENGHILIPGFYDNVRPLDIQERELNDAVPLDQQAWLEQTGAPMIWGEPDYSLIERIGTRPTLDVNGIVGGYTGAGSKTVLPSKAHAKISMRLVPDQDPLDIFKLFEDYVSSIAPPTVSIQFTLANVGLPSVVDYEVPAMKAAYSALELVFSRKPILVREGGSIPIVSIFQEQLDLETVLMGFGLPDDRIHSPNERFYIPNFHQGTEAVIRFFEQYALGHKSSR